MGIKVVTTVAMWPTQEPTIQATLVVTAALPWTAVMVAMQATPLVVSLFTATCTDRHVPHVFSQMSQRLVVYISANGRNLSFAFMLYTCLCKLCYPSASCTVTSNLVTFSGKTCIVGESDNTMDEQRSDGRRLLQSGETHSLRPLLYSCLQLLIQVSHADRLCTQDFMYTCYINCFDMQTSLACWV